MTYLGIDPGSSSGAYVLITSEKHILLAKDFTSYSDIVHDLKDVKIFHAVLEHVHAFPKQGVSSVFKFGANFGAWEGILTALEIPYSLITPQRWQKSILDSAKAKGNTKAAALAFVQRQYPGRRFNKTSGISDALCMAHYAKEIGKLTAIQYLSEETFLS